MLAELSGVTTGAVRPFPLFVLCAVTAAVKCLTAILKCSNAATKEAARPVITGCCWIVREDVRAQHFPVDEPIWSTSVGVWCIDEKESAASFKQTDNALQGDVNISHHSVDAGIVEIADGGDVILLLKL